MPAVEARGMRTAIQQADEVDKAVPLLREAAAAVAAAEVHKLQWPQIQQQQTAARGWRWR